MKILNEPLKDIEWFEEAAGRIAAGERIRIAGSADSHRLHLMDALKTEGRPLLILTWSERRSREICEEFSFYDREACVYPAKDLIFYQADINGREAATERLKALKLMRSDSPCSVVTTIDTLLGCCMPPEILEAAAVDIHKGSIIDTKAIAMKLTAMGYENNYQAESPGQFSIRGGIIDIYDLTAENPVRIELWGDEADSVRSFDAQSQRSIEELEKVRIYPASELILTEERKLAGFRRIEADMKKQMGIFREAGQNEEYRRLKISLEELEAALIDGMGGINLESYLRYFYEDTVSFLSLFRNRPVIMLDEPARLLEHVRGVLAEFTESMSHRLEKGYLIPGQLKLLKSEEELIHDLSSYPGVQFNALEGAAGMFGGEKEYSLFARTLSSFNGSFSTLVRDLKKLKSEGNRIVILSPSRTRAKRLAEDLANEEIVAAYTENSEKILQRGEIVTFYGRIRKGFSYPGIGFTVIAETDIFGSERKRGRKKPKFSGGVKIKDHAQLHIGDYVIHENYGIGIYRGIEKVEVEHVAKDYMKIEYRDGGNLYVLATSLDMIQLYADKDSKKPKLNKLGTQEWNRTKSKVREAVGGVAKELVSLYAARSSREGYHYGPDTVWQKEFEEMFPYEETEDQLAAINSTKDDMESGKIMDRLICGDVGFGKTEVAIRAAFKAVQDGKQVAYLVPTTILAEQHYNTFRERMSGYPVRVEMLSRFRTPGQIKQTLTDLKKGLVDIVIGTHRLLSKDVEYKDLGLLVVDEEQRFGVSHKEKIKQLKETVDVLTLTATPIPRTLHMSLVGIRDMSLLEEPPRDRQPIQTFVCEYNEEMVREAIRRELGRGGQVYYVYNRVESIQEMSAEVSKLVPEARVAFAHGQMNERELEDIMLSFIHREIDVLVSTTIIETGLDIPNVNTMIIHDSDKMGLSQLYQLRGRVGRSDRLSYAFLMYRRDKVLKEVATKRLTAIREFTELGSGFKIAMRDLEIRGAGTLLGKQQHGHIESVGYDLYCRMLEDAVRTEKGGAAAPEGSCTVDLDVDAFIPEEYIVNEIQKLDIYKRIAAIQNSEDADAMRDELRDRFGELPERVSNLLAIALIKAEATALFIKDIRGRAGRIRIQMDRNAPAEVRNIPLLINEYAGSLKMTPGPAPEFNYSYDIEGLAEQDEKMLLSETAALVDKFNMLYAK